MFDVRCSRVYGDRREATKEISQPQGGWFIVISSHVLKGHWKEEPLPVAPNILTPAQIPHVPDKCETVSHFYK
jgi:hypothetical protein